MNNTFNIDSPYLQHYGVLGMKWGIRRYQNPDGTLTALGRKRVQKAMKSRDIMMTTKDKREHNQAEKEFRKITSKLYPAEMQNLIERVERDEALRRLSQVEQEDKVLKGMQYANEALKVVGTAAMTTSSIVSVVSGINNIKSGNVRLGLEQERFALEKQKAAREEAKETREILRQRKADEVQAKKDALDLLKKKADINQTKAKTAAELFKAKEKEELNKKIKDLSNKNDDLETTLLNMYNMQDRKIKSKNEEINRLNNEIRRMSNPEPYDYDVETSDLAREILKRTSY